MEGLFTKICVVILMVVSTYARSVQFKISVKPLQRDFEQLLYNTKMSIKKLETIKERKITTIQDNDSWSNCAVVRMYSRSGVFLTVKGNKVKGVSVASINPDQGNFQIESYGKSIIRLKDIKTNKYLMMTKRGHIGLTNQRNDESLFLQHLEENSYTTFSSEKYFVNSHNDLFISVKKNGKIRPAKNTGPGQKSSQFLVDFTRTDMLCAKR